MNVAVRLIEQAIGNLEERGTGIFVKHLRNGDIFTCRCPECGTFHGAYPTAAEAWADRLCRHCNRQGVEKLKKDIQKVDEPKPQKNIFQHPMNKPSVIEAFDDDDFDVKTASEEPGDYVGYTLFDGQEWFPVTEKGLLGRQNYRSLEEFSGQWRLMGFYPKDRRKTGLNRLMMWPEIKRRLAAGETVTGYPYDFDHGSYRGWSKLSHIYPTTSWNIAENLGDYGEDDIKDILGHAPGEELPLGEVNKEVCVSAHHRQEFYSRLEFGRDGFPKRARVNGKCKTWKTRPNEYRLPVKFGLDSCLYITNDSEGDWSTVPLDAHGNPIR